MAEIDAAFKAAILDSIAASQLMLMAVDSTGSVTYWNPTAVAVYGWSAEEAIGRDVVELLVDPDARFEARALLRAVVADGRGTQGQFRTISRQGDPILLWWSVSPVPDEGPEVGLVAVSADMTAHDAAVRQLASSEARFRALAEGSPIGICTGNRRDGCTFANRRLGAILGLEPAECLGHGWAAVVHPGDRDWVVEAFRREAAKATEIGLHYRVVRPDGSIRQVATTLAAYLSPELDDEWVGTVDDITDRLRAEEELARQALHDPLTGLPNRVLLAERIERALGRIRPSDTSLAVLFIDLDGFKAVNDDHGHASGDTVLSQVADRLRGVVRPADTVGRLAGDEFIVLCEELRAPAVDRVTERIREALERPYEVDGHSISLRASIGTAATATSDGSDYEGLIAAADAAMYRDKQRGRGGV